MTLLTIAQCAECVSRKPLDLYYDNKHPQIYNIMLYSYNRLFVASNNVDSMEIPSFRAVAMFSYVVRVSKP